MAGIEVNDRPGDLLLISSLLVIAFLAPAITGCLGGEDDDVFDVVLVTIAPLREVVRSIAAEDTEVVVMVPEGQDPHSYSPKPSQLLRASKADIYFKVGSGIEFEELHLQTITEQNRGMLVTDLSEGIDIFDFDEHYGQEDHEGSGTDHEGHDHEGGDPHIWLSPSNMRIMAQNVLSGFLEADPDNAELYQKNHRAYDLKLQDAVSEIKDMLEPYRGEEFLAYHPSWGYFGDEFELVQIAIEEDGKRPGPQGIASLIDQAKEHNITVVFIELQFDTSDADVIADAIGGEVVTVDPLSPDYIDNLTDVAEKMRAGFQ
jgi:zinc transport system substrate-binding protein